MTALETGKTYILQSPYNQQTIDLHYGSYCRGEVWAHPLNRSQSQKWILDGKGDFFTLKSASTSHPSRVDHVLSFDTATSQLCCNEFFGDPAQFWHGEQVGPQEFVLKCRYNNSAITVNGPQDVLTLEEANAENYQRQRWKLIEV